MVEIKPRKPDHAPIYNVYTTLIEQHATAPHIGSGVNWCDKPPTYAPYTLEVETTSYLGWSHCNTNNPDHVITYKITSLWCLDDTWGTTYTLPAVYVSKSVYDPHSYKWCIIHSITCNDIPHNTITKFEVMSWFLHSLFMSALVSSFCSVNGNPVVFVVKEVQKSQSRFNMQIFNSKCVLNRQRH